MSEKLPAIGVRAVDIVPVSGKLRGRINNALAASFKNEETAGLWASGSAIFGSEATSVLVPRRAACESSRKEVTRR